MCERERESDEYIDHIMFSREGREPFCLLWAGLSASVSSVSYFALLSQVMSKEHLKA